MSQSGDSRRQASLQMTGERRVDEHGQHDRWNRGGVYDSAGEFDLRATEELLAERFGTVRQSLPETVGEYKLKETQREYTATYYREGEFEGVHGITATERFVRIFPRGPHLNDWTVGIEERTPKYATNDQNGWGSWQHQQAQKLDSPGAAAATALAIMREEVPLRCER